MRPSTPPEVITSSPFCSPSVIDLCSLARFICGRIMMKYSSTNIRMIGRNPVQPPPSAAPGIWAKAEEISTESPIGCSRAKNYTIRPPPAPGSFRRARRGPLLAQVRGTVAQPPQRDRLAQLAHEAEVEMQVVQRVEPRAQYLVHLLQVVEIGAREVPARVAGAGVVERARVGAVRCI